MTPLEGKVINEFSHVYYYIGWVEVGGHQAQIISSFVCEA